MLSSRWNSANKKYEHHYFFYKYKFTLLSLNERKKWHRYPPGNEYIFGLKEKYLMKSSFIFILINFLTMSTLSLLQDHQIFNELSIHKNTSTGIKKIYNVNDFFLYLTQHRTSPLQKACNRDQHDSSSIV